MTFILNEDTGAAINRIKLDDFHRNPYLVSFKHALPQQFLVQEVSQNHLLYTRLHPETRIKYPELAEIVITKDPLLAVYIPPAIFKFDYLLKTTEHITGCIRLYSMLRASKSWSNMFDTIIREQAHQLLTLLSVQEITPYFLYEVFLSYRLQSQDETLPPV